MTTVGDDLARVLTAVPTTGLHTATFVGMIGHLARVRIADVDIDVPIVGAAILRAGETVQMMWLDGSGIVLGPAVPRPSFGTVTAVEPPYATVDVDGSAFSFPYRIGAAPVTGDLVEINWASGIIGGAVSARPVSPVIPPAPTPPDQDVEYVIRALSSWRYETEWIEGDPRTGPGITSIWIYGDLTGTLDGVTLTSIDILLPSAGGADTITIGTHTTTTDPVDPPNLTNLTPTTDAGGWTPIPTALAAAILAGGVGITGDAESAWTGVLSDPSSGALRFRGYIEGA